MKEITMITTCEITAVEKCSDEQAELVANNMEAIKNTLPALIKSELHADNVNILKNQIFIRDVPN